MHSVTPRCLSRYRRSRPGGGLRIEARVGLVESSSEGSLMSERAITSRRFIPPESGST